MKLGKPSKWLYEHVFAVFKILLFVLSTLYFFMLIWDSLESVMWIVLEWCIPLTGGFLFYLTVCKKQWILTSNSRFLVFINCASILLFFEACLLITRELLYGTVIACVFVALAFILGSFLLFFTLLEWDQLGKFSRNIGIISIVLWTWFGTIDATIYYELCPTCHTECQTLRIRILCYPIYSKTLKCCEPASIWHFPNSKTCLHSFIVVPKVRLLGLIVPIYLDISDEYMGMFSQEQSEGWNHYLWKFG